MPNFATKESFKLRVANALASTNANNTVIADSAIVVNTRLSNDDIQIKYFVSDHDSAPRTVDYANRVSSLVDAAKLLKIQDAVITQKLTALLETTKEKLKIECDIDQALDKLKKQYQIKLQNATNTAALETEYKKQRLKIIENINANFDEIIFRIIWGTHKPRNFFTRLLRPITKSVLGDVFQDNIIHFIREPGETNGSAIARLKTAEIELVKAKGRPEAVNVFFTPAKKDSVSELYYTYQAPVTRYTTAQKQQLPAGQPDEYFYPASVNNTEGVANFNREILGKFNDGSSEVKRKFYTHCALPPLGIKDEVKRMSITARNAEQIVEILAEQRLAEALSLDARTLETNNEENPLAVEMTEIRLLSMMRNNWIFNLFDKRQHQYEQTLEMFLAFNMLNNKTFKVSVKTDANTKREIYIKPDIRFGNFGVNGFRNEIFADAFLNVINTRYFNQVFAANISELLDSEEHSINADQSNLPSISPAYRDAYNKTVIAQQTLDAQFHRLHLLLKAAETNSAAIPQYQKQRTVVMNLLENQHANEKALLNHQKDFIRQLSNCNVSGFDTISKELVENMVQAKELMETPLHSWVENTVSFVNSVEFIPRGFKEFLSRFSVTLGNVFDKYFCFLKRYTFAENNYHLQNILARMNDAEERELLIGCRENKDRGGRMNATLMNDAIYREENNHYPRYNKTEQTSVFNKLLAWVLPRSTAFFNSEYCSVPGARGFDIQSSHGNEHLDFLRENKPMARWGKDVFSITAGFSIVDTVIKVKNWCVKKFSGSATRSIESPRRNYGTANAAVVVAATALLTLGATTMAPASTDLANISQSAGITDVISTNSTSPDEISGQDIFDQDLNDYAHISKVSRFEAKAKEAFKDYEHASKEVRGIRKKGERDDDANAPAPKSAKDIVAVIDDQSRRDKKSKPKDPESGGTPDLNDSAHEEVKGFLASLFAHKLKPSGTFQPRHTEIHTAEDSPHHTSDPPSLSRH